MKRTYVISTEPANKEAEVVTDYNRCYISEACEHGWHDPSAQPCGRRVAEDLSSDERLGSAGLTSPAGGSAQPDCQPASPGAGQESRGTDWMEGYDFALRNFNTEPVQADLALLRDVESDGLTQVASDVEPGSGPAPATKAGPHAHDDFCGCGDAIWALAPLVVMLVLVVFLLTLGLWT